MATNRAGSRPSARGGGGRNHNATIAPITPITHMKKKKIYEPLKKKAAK